MIETRGVLRRGSKFGNVLEVDRNGSRSSPGFERQVPSLADYLSPRALKGTVTQVNCAFLASSRVASFIGSRGDDENRLVPQAYFKLLTNEYGHDQQTVGPSKNKIFARLSPFCIEQ
jgi:hypothetical protein